MCIRCELSIYICIGIELGVFGGLLVIKAWFVAVLIELGGAVFCVVRLPWVMQSDRPRYGLSFIRLIFTVL